MWVELGIPAQGKTEIAGSPRTWINTDHIVRVEFMNENGKFVATVISIKPGGSDRSIYFDDDAKRIKQVLEHSTKGKGSFVPKINAVE